MTLEDCINSNAFELHEWYESGANNWHPEDVYINRVWGAIRNFVIAENIEKDFKIVTCLGDVFEMRNMQFYLNGK